MKIRSLLLLVFGFGLAAYAAQVGAAPTAPPSGGLAYDEIDRMILGAATPPPAGNFEADVAALARGTTVAAATDAPKKRGISLGNVAGAILSGRPGDIAGNAAGAIASEAIANSIADAATRAVAGSLATFNGILQGRLERHAVLGSWERTDDIAAGMATILKCDLSQLIKLDLGKKTYRVIDTSAKPASSLTAPPAQAPPRQQPASAPVRDEPPGTAVLQLAHATQALGAATLSGTPTQHFTSTNTAAMTQATGSCKNGSFTIAQDQYLSGFDQPRAYCPLPPIAAREIRQYPRDPQTMVARGGCKPTITFQNSGPVEPAGKLALYSLLTMSGSASAPGQTAAGGFSFLSERGNLRRLSAADRALFEVPADFTKEP